MITMHRQLAQNLGPEEILRKLQDISEDESDASEGGIFDTNEDEDEEYESLRAANHSSSDCDAVDTCMLEEEFEDHVQQQVMPAMNFDKQGAIHDIGAQQEEIEDEAEAKEELISLVSC